MMMEEEEDLFQELKQVKQKWQESYEAAVGHAQALRSCGNGDLARDSASLPRLNALAQDCLSALRSFQRQFDLLAQQLVSIEEKDACSKMLEEWKSKYQSLHATLRSANLQAKSNLQKAAKKERELLLGGGEEFTDRRRNLQTQAGMSAAAESITESLRRARQMMVQELERGANTLAVLDDSNTTLRKADSEYKGQRSLLTTTRGLLSVMGRQDVLDRIILIAGFILFCIVVSYVFNQRIGVYKLSKSKSSTSGSTATPTISKSTPVNSVENRKLESQQENCKSIQGQSLDICHSENVIGVKPILEVEL